MYMFLWQTSSVVFVFIVIMHIYNCTMYVCVTFRRLDFTTSPKLIEELPMLLPNYDRHAL